jgi:ABC-type multidrug transport system fused ATPase/permease subunit
MAALNAASAEDVVEALEDGLSALVEEKGRNFSGGQLQRLRLARALIADPEFLIAVEATSAVDAHTEARIAERIGAYRAGRDGLRGTVLFTTSPLVLDHADVVAYVEGSRVVATGRHAELLASQPGYRLLVTRGEDESQDASKDEKDEEDEESRDSAHDASKDQPQDESRATVGEALDAADGELGRVVRS